MPARMGVWLSRGHRLVVHDDAVPALEAGVDIVRTYALGELHLALSGPDLA